MRTFRLTVGIIYIYIHICYTFFRYYVYRYYSTICIKITCIKYHIVHCTGILYILHHGFLRPSQMALGRGLSEEKFHELVELLSLGDLLGEAISCGPKDPSHPFSKRPNRPVRTYSTMFHPFSTLRFFKLSPASRRQHSQVLLFVADTLCHQPIGYLAAAAGQSSLDRGPALYARTLWQLWARKTEDVFFCFVFSHGKDTLWIPLAKKHMENHQINI